MHTRRNALLGIGALGASAIALRLHPRDRAGVINFEVPRRYPYVAKRVNAAGGVDRELTELQTALRMDRVVIVQPSVYGADNSCSSMPSASSAHAHAPWS